MGVDSEAAASISIRNIFMPIAVPQLLRRVITNIPLRWVVVVPFVLQTVGVVALVGYLSYRSGQQATENLANQLLRQTSERVSDRLDHYLHTPQQIVAANHLAVEQGMLNLNDREQLRQQLWQWMCLNPSLSSDGFWSAAGDAIGYVRINSEAVDKLAEKVTGQTIPLGAIFFNEIKPHQRRYFWTDAQGKPGNLAYQLNDDFRSVPWYRQAKSMRKQGWTPVSLARVVPVLQIVAIAPVHTAAGKLQGFFTANYFLPEISLFLTQLQFSPTGQVFIIERSGDLVATSVASEASGVRSINGTPDRLSALTSQDERTQEIARQLIRQFGNFDRLKAPQQLSLGVAGQRLFVQVTPYNDQYGLDWHVVTVIPESDFMADIHRNRLITALLCLLALGGTIASGLFAAHRFTARIARLNQASRELANGNLTQQLPVNSPIAEVNELAQSFNQMAAQLQQLFQSKLAEEATRQSEARLAGILEIAKDAIISIDESQQIALFNQGAERIFGYTLEEAIGQPLTLLLPDRFAALHHQHVVSFGQTAEQSRQMAGRMQIFGRRKDGTEFPAQASIAKLQLPGKTIFTVFLQDITERKLAEERLQQSEAKLNTIVTTISDGILVLDQKGNVRFANPAANRILGEELLGYQWRIPVGEISEIVIHSADLVSRTLEMRSSETNWMGQTAYIVVVRDISDRKRTELALQAKTEELDRFFSTALDLLCIANTDGYFLRLNPQWEKTLGYSLQELEGSRFLDYVHPADLDSTLDKIMRLAERQEVLTFVNRYRCQDGSYRWLEWRSLPVGNLIYATARDITEHKYLEQELIKNRDFRELLFNESGDALFLVDSVTLLTIDCNQQAIEMFEVTSKSELMQIQGHVLQKRQFTPEELVTIQQEIDQKGFWNLEVEYVTRQGREFWGDLCVKQLTFGDQRFNLVRVTDISDRKVTEFALQRSEARYLAILEDQTELITRFQPDGTLLFVNDAYCRYVGITKEQVSGFNYQPLVYPDDQPAIDRCLAALSPEHPVGTVENRILARGVVRWTQWTNRAIYDPQGNLIELQSVGRDINDLKQAEQALRRSEERLQLALEASGDGIWDWNIATHEIYYSPQYFQMLGYAADELPHSVNTWYQLVHPEDMVWVRELLAKHFADASVRYQFDYRVRTKSGSWKWVADYGKVVARDEQGHPLRMIGTHRDVSDRKQAEFALRQSEQKFKGAFDTITVGMALISLTGGFQEVNTTLCRMLGYGETELLTLRLEDVEEPLDQRVDFSLTEQMMAGEIPGYQVEKRFLRKDGQLFWGLLNIALMRDAHGQLLYLIAQITDISDRKQAELKVQAALAEKQVLLQEVYHRVKNNLQLIQSMLQMQQRRLNNPEAVQALRESWNRVMAISLVHEILYQSDNLAQINLKEYVPILVQHIAASYHSTAPTVVVKTEVNSIIVPMKTAICCGLILNELVTNAMKYAFPDGRAGQVGVELFIASSEPKHPITLIVRDNGIGLPNPIHLSTSKTLGLNLVQDFVDQLRGSMTVESSQGSLFRITFKLNHEPIPSTQ